MAGRLRAGSVTAAVAVSLVLAAAGAGAQDNDAAPEKLVCTFSTGTSVSYEAGGFRSKPASTLAFTVTKIDLEAQSAELVTSEGSPPVTLRVIRAVNANHFLEVVNEGFLNLTTIYDKDPKTGLHPAVHSRHLGLLGQPVFGQYTGTCSE
ncbi:MAG: hypothetical protein ACM3L9_09815 [Deltaproteobacteria bacterium]